MNFGKNLQTLRKARSISQEKLAEELNVSRQAIGKWESGMVYPDVERLVQISSYFNISMDELIKGTVSTDVSEVENITAAEIGTSSYKHWAIRIVIAIALFALCPFIPGETGNGTIKTFLMLLCIVTGIALLIYNQLLKKHGR